MSVRLANLTDADVAAERERFPLAFGRSVGERAKFRLTYTVEEAATLVGVARSTMYELVRSRRRRRAPIRTSSTLGSAW